MSERTKIEQLQEAILRICDVIAYRVASKDEIKWIIDSIDFRDELKKRKPL